MKNTVFLTMAGAAAIAAAGPGAAKEREIGYPEGSLGAQAILSADYATAERQLDDFRVYERDPGRLINLGVVLAKTGRTEAAVRHFEQVLEEDDVELILADGRTMRSHDIARTALQNLGTSR
ncbi:MAG: hypothetical protein ACLGHC_00025 [Alphaproteobacteria bacterium]